jgi:tellurite resistance protein
MEESASRRAMMTWVGALAKGGVAADPDTVAGEAVAAFVVGEAALASLRTFLAEADEATARRERRAAVEVCIWMAHADRVIDPEERHLLRQLVGASRLDPDTQDELVEAVHVPPPIDGVEERLTHPVLRELMLALAWELALSDGRVDQAEEDLFDGLAKRLDVKRARARELREAMTAQIS